MAKRSPFKNAIVAHKVALNDGYDKYACVWQPRNFDMVIHSRQLGVGSAGMKMQMSMWDGLAR